MCAQRIVDAATQWDGLGVSSNCSNWLRATWLSTIGVIGCAGGTTGDFSGDLVDCENVSEVSLDDGSHLGFSPESILAFSEGEYTTPIRWFSPCANPDSPCGRKGCQGKPRPGADGTETTLHISVRRTGEEATVHHGKTQCAEHMQVPVELTLASDDGLLEEQFAAFLGTETGRDSSASALGLVQDLNGQLPYDEAFGEETGFDFGMWFYPEAVEVDLYVTDAASRTPLLVDLLPPYDSCTTFIDAAK